MVLPVRLPKSFLQTMKETILKDNKLGNIVSKDIKADEQLSESFNRRGRLDPFQIKSPDEHMEEVANDKNPLAVDIGKVSGNFEDCNLQNEKKSEQSQNEGNQLLKVNAVVDNENALLLSHDPQQENHRNVPLPKVKEIGFNERHLEEETNKNLAFESDGNHEMNDNNLLDEGIDVIVKENINEEENLSYKKSDKIVKSNHDDNKTGLLESTKITVFPTHRISSNRTQDAMYSANSQTDVKEKEKEPELIESLGDRLLPLSPIDQPGNYLKDSVRDVQDPQKLDKDVFFARNDVNSFEGDIPETRNKVLVRDSIDGTFAIKEEYFNGNKKVSTSAKPEEVSPGIEENGKCSNLDDKAESPVGSPRKSVSEKPLQRNDSIDSKVSEGSNSKESVSRRRTRSASEQHTSKTLSVLKNFFDAFDRRKLQRHLSDNYDSKLQGKIIDIESVNRESQHSGKEFVVLKVDEGHEAGNRESRVIGIDSKVPFTRENELKNFGRADEEGSKSRASDNPVGAPIKSVESSLQTTPEEKNAESQNKIYQTGSMDSKSDDREDERKTPIHDPNSVVDVQLDEKTHGKSRSEIPFNVTRQSDDDKINGFQDGIQCGIACKSTALSSMTSERPNQPFDIEKGKHDPMLISKNHAFLDLEQEKPNVINQVNQFSTAECADLPFKRHTLNVENYHVDVKTTSNLVPFVTTNLINEGNESMEPSTPDLTSSKHNNASSGVVFKITIERTPKIEKRSCDSIEDSNVAINNDKPKDAFKKPGPDPDKPIVLESDPHISKDVVPDLSKSRNKFSAKDFSEKDKIIENLSSNVESCETGKNRDKIEIGENNRQQIKNHASEKVPRPPHGRATNRPVAGR